MDKFKVGDSVIVRYSKKGFSVRTTILSSMDIDDMFLISYDNVKGTYRPAKANHDFYKRKYTYLEIHEDIRLFKDCRWVTKDDIRHGFVKDTKIARLIHKSNTEKIEGGKIYLKEIL